MFPPAGSVCSALIAGYLVGVTPARGYVGWRRAGYRRYCGLAGLWESPCFQTSAGWVDDPRDVFGVRYGVCGIVWLRILTGVSFAASSLGGVGLSTAR